MQTGCDRIGLFIAWPTLVGVLACLCPGTQPCGVFVAVLEDWKQHETIFGQEPSRAPGAWSYAQAAYLVSLLAAGRPVSDVTCIYADFQ